MKTNENLKKNAFFDFTKNIAKSAFERYTREGYTIDTEGFYICPKCKTRASKISNIGIMMPYPCECEKARLSEAENKRKKEKAEERRVRCFPFQPMREQTFSIDNGTNPKITAIMKKYVEEFPNLKSDGKGLLLCGSTGTGKSFFASCVANALIDNGYDVKQTSFSRIEKETTQCAKQTVIDSYAENDLVIIDDLGTERSTDFMKELVFNTVDTLYNARTPIIITTNLTIDTLTNPSDKNDERVYQRILERCAWVEFSGDSQRVKNIIEGYSRSCELLGL